MTSITRTITRTMHNRKPRFFIYIDRRPKCGEMKQTRNNPTPAGRTQPAQITKPRRNA